MNLTRKQFVATLGATLTSPWLAGLFGLPGTVANARACAPFSSWKLPIIDPTLLAWLKAVRSPVFESDDPVLKNLIAAVLRQEPVEFCYWGGSEPGSERRVTPGLVFRVQDFPGHYLAGYCHLRQAERVFSVERMDFGEPGECGRE